MAVSSLFLSGAAIVASFLVSGTAAGGSGYTLNTEYSGADFFDGFDFFTETDPTFGFVDYVDEYTALQNNLISASENGPAIIGVDSTTVLSAIGTGRQSVRITTKESWTHGLFLLDASNMPGGACGTWPAWWSTGPDWPAGGAMDIIEGVNSNDFNTLSLQTAPNCSISGTGQTASIQNYDCDEAANGGVGCGSVSSAANSYGLDFNSNNGGVYATEWTSQYIKTWFFPRKSIPKDITNGNPDPTGWGTPLANFQGDCDIDSHFYENQFVLNTDFCGQWAGAVWSDDETCSKLAKTCEEYVAENPKAFVDMYWAINSLKVYSNTDTVSYAAPSTTSSSGIATPTSVSTVTSISDLPACGLTCFDNMLNQYASLGCNSSTNATCLCENSNFANGLHDCSYAICSAPVADSVVEFGQTWCAAALPSVTTSSSAIATPTSVSTLPACGQTCFDNMLSQWSSLGCSSSTDDSCLCQNVNFANGLHDCSYAICTAAEAAQVVTFGQTWCAAAQSSASSLITTASSTSIPPFSITTPSSTRSSPVPAISTSASVASIKSSTAVTSAATSSISGSSLASSGSLAASSRGAANSSPIASASASTSASIVSSVVPAAPSAVGSFQYLGCYSSDDAFDTFLTEGSSRMLTLEYCTEECAGTGDKYAGIWDTSCYCASTFDEDSLVPMPDASCDIPCAGDASEICGGGVASSKRGLSSKYLTIYVDSVASSSNLTSSSNSSSAYPSSSSTTAGSSASAASDSTAIPASASASLSSSSVSLSTSVSSSAPYGNLSTSTASSSPSSSVAVTNTSSTASVIYVVSTATVIPVAAVTSSSDPSLPTGYTISTVYSTNIYTITSCAATVTNCPARMGQVTTEIISLYTTICPVEETQTVPASITRTKSRHHPTATLPSYTTVVVTTYVDICPEGTLSTYTTSQTQVITSTPGAAVWTPSVSMTTMTTTLVNGETVTLTVPRTKATKKANSTAIAASVWNYKYGGNSTSTGAAVATTSSYVSASGASDGFVAGKGVVTVIAAAFGVAFLL